MFETAMFSRRIKHQFVMLSLVLPLLCAGHTFWMDCGGCLCVFLPTPHFDVAQSSTVFEIVTRSGTMMSYPNSPSSCSCDLSYYFNSTSISDRIVLINRASDQINSFTLKMETVASDLMLLHLPTHSAES